LPKNRRAAADRGGADAPVFLRALEAEDVVRTHRWHNDPALYETLGGTFRHVSMAVEEEWLRKARLGSSGEVSLAICLREKGTHMGNVYLRDIDWVSRRAELHILIGEGTHRGRGFGEAAVRLLVRHAFRDLGLRRIYLFVLATNAPAIRVYEKCGFVVEGTLREHTLKGGAFRDVLLMGVLSGKEQESSDTTGRRGVSGPRAPRRTGPGDE